MEPKTVSIVIGSYNRCRFLKLAIASVREELERSSLAGEIIVVDGGSTDGALAWLVKQKDIITIVQHNRGEWRGQRIERRSWGYFMNLGFKCAQGKYICMLSDDCLVVPSAISNGYQLFENKSREEKIGAIAFWWRNGLKENIYHLLTFAGVLYVNHGLYLREALVNVGYADEDTYRFYNADIDLGLKLWHAGYKTLESPDSYVEHYPHAGTELRKENIMVSSNDIVSLQRKWQGFLDINGKPIDDIHQSIMKSYIDKNNTAQRFNNAIIAEKISFSRLFGLR